MVSRRQESRVCPIEFGLQRASSAEVNEWHTANAGTIFPDFPDRQDPSPVYPSRIAR